MSRTIQQRRAWVEIDLPCMQSNVKAIRSALPAHLKYIAVVKADAYGHGIAAIASRLMRSGADLFAVANLEEAASIRELGQGWPILILSPLLATEIPEAIRQRVIPVISSIEEAQAIAKAAQKQNVLQPLHLKMDTGMGRAGVWFEQAGELLQKIIQHPALKLSGCCTHFACADSDPKFTALQRQRFLEVVDDYAHATSDLLFHADNSAGVNSFPEDGIFNAMRIGLLQFGVNPHPRSFLSATAVQPALSFYTRIGLIKQLPAGTGISYGQTHHIKKSTRMAILTAGYADGIPTALSNKGKVIIHNTLCPILGRVTMDQTIVDISAVPQAREGDVATLVGKSESHTLSATEFANAANLIEWEFFCNLSKRVTRIYHPGPQGRP